MHRIALLMPVLVLSVVLTRGTPCAASDTQKPNIAAVYLQNSWAAAGDTMESTVYAFDNVGVTAVTVAGFSLSHTSGGQWKGTITVEPGLGWHYPGAVAYDAAGNASNVANLAAYEIRDVCAMPISSLNHSIMASAMRLYLYKTWGSVAAIVDADRFDLLDGSGTTILVLCPAHGRSVGDRVVARGHWQHNGAPRRWLDCLPCAVRKVD